MLGRTSPRLYLAQFFRQLAILVSSGISLEKALEICANQTSSPALRAQGRDLSQQVRHGVRLSDAVARVGAPFSTLHSGVILAAESTGEYDEGFEQLAEWEENSDRVERKIRALSTYPALVCVVAALGTYLLLRFLTPLIASVAQQVDGELPPATKFILNVGQVVDSNLFLVAVFVLMPLAWWLARRVWALQRVRSWWERISLSVPLLGALLKKAWLVRTARCLQSLMGAGLPMVRCIELAADASGNAFLGQNVLRGAAYGVLRGETLSQALPPWILSRAFVGMLAVGETSGHLPEMLGRVADLHEVELGADIESVFHAAEPILIGVVGLVVLVTLFCAFQPLYTLMVRL